MRSIRGRKLRRVYQAWYFRKGGRIAKPRIVHDFILWETSSGQVTERSGVKLAALAYAQLMVTFVK